MIAYAVPIARLLSRRRCFSIRGVRQAVHWRSSIEEVRSDGLPWPAVFRGCHCLTQLVGGFSGRPPVSSRGWARCCWPGLRSLPLCSASLLASPRSRVPHELTTSLEHVAIVGWAPLALRPRLPRQRMMDRK